MAGETSVPDRAVASAFQLGEWTVEPELNSLRKGAVQQRIEPKVMKVLLTLATHGNRVVSKEALIAAVWPDTFVSDDVLTRCISILRRITRDDSQAPRFIQTVPRRGYRLLAPVIPIPGGSSELTSSPEHIADLASVIPSEQNAGPVSAEAPRLAVPLSPVTAQTPLSPRPVVTALAALSLALLVGLLLWIGFVHHRRSHAILPASFRTVQFTAYAGEQTQPAFSPDGSRIAYVATSEDGRSRRIYVQHVGRETTVELTPGRAGEQFSPAWSPDGRSIAYLSRSNSELGIDIAPVDSQVGVRRVFTPQEPSHWDQGALAWSSDGRTLIFPDHAGSEPHSSIYALDLQTGKARALTSPPAGWEGDLNPAFSPDGKRIAFTRASETSVRYLCWLSFAGGRVISQIHQVTRDRMTIDSLAWSADGGSVIFSSNRGGKYALWTIGLSGGTPQRLPVGTEDAFEPSVGPKPGELAYAEGSAIWSIVRVRAGAKGTPPTSLLTSTQQDSAPSISPDGHFLAFQSLRSGTQEIWISSISGHAMRQLTFAGGPLTGSPAWSHGGETIAFDSRPDGHSHIFAVAAAGGQPVQLTFGDSNDIVPRWSHDDRLVYYRSNRGGHWQLWKVLSTGGEPKLVSDGDGIEPQESADGRWLYYTRGDEAGLWRMPAEGGRETRVLSQPAAGYWGYWQLELGQIFYLDLTGGRPMIRVAASTPESTAKPGSVFAELQETPPRYAGIAVTNGEKSVLMTEERAAGRHITLVQPQ